MKKLLYALTLGLFATTAVFGQVPDRGKPEAPRSTQEAPRSLAGDKQVEPTDKKQDAKKKDKKAPPKKAAEPKKDEVKK